MMEDSYPQKIDPAPLEVLRKQSEFSASVVRNDSGVWASDEPRIEIEPDRFADLE